MKKLLFTALTVALALAGSPSFAQEVKVKTGDGKLKAKPAAMKKDMKEEEMKMKMEAAGKDMAYPYQAEYSSQFAFGPSAHAKLVLDMWKAWDDNNLDWAAGMVADTILFHMPNGNMVSGKEAFISTGQEQRDKYTRVKSTVEAWMPLKSMDRGENWVAIWGRDESTNKEGETTTHMMHEIWRINKDGKIDYLRQYTCEVANQPPAQKQ